MRSMHAPIFGVAFTNVVYIVLGFPRFKFFCRRCMHSSRFNMGFPAGSTLLWPVLCHHVGSCSLDTVLCRFYNVYSARQSYRSLSSKLIEFCWDSTQRNSLLVIVWAHF